MNIIIPMAGMGKRMRPHTLTTPKPLLPVAGKPIVQRMVEDIISTSKEEVEEIAFIINPKFGEKIEEQLLGIAKDLNATGKICYQTEALGTAHAILSAAECMDSNILIAFADTLFKANFDFDANKDAIIWTQKVDDPSAFGVVKLNDSQEIEAFVEKPQEFVSDLAIIGVYYFKDGANLRKELQRLIDNDIKLKGEYQITDAMDHMLKQGMKFYTDVVEEWLDCGNKDATVYTNQRILELKKDTEELVHSSVVTENAVIIPPCYIAEGCVIKNAVVGPHVSMEAGVHIEDARISNTIVQADSIVKNACISNSMLGKSVNYNEKPQNISIGDFSTRS